MRAEKEAEHFPCIDREVVVKEPTAENRHIWRAARIEMLCSMKKSGVVNIAIYGRHTDAQHGLASDAVGGMIDLIEEWLSCGRADDTKLMVPVMRNRAEDSSKRQQQIPLAVINPAPFCSVARTVALLRGPTW